MSDLRVIVDLIHPTSTGAETLVFQPGEYDDSVQIIDHDGDLNIRLLNGGTVYVPRQNITMVALIVVPPDDLLDDSEDGA